jgi:ComF family protein
MFTSLLSRIGWPSQCLICHSWPTASLCTRCVARFAISVPRCATCALPVPVGVERCGACLQEPPPLDRCLAATSYRWPWAQCIAGFKFSNDAGLAAPLATLMAAAPGVAAALHTADVVVPLPLSPERLAERGYNPALLLAECLNPRRLQRHALQRVRHTLPQSALPRDERLKNVRGAYAVQPSHAHALQGRHVLLVDDVMTTGASVYEAARAVRAAGAAHVTALVFARTDVPH